MDEKNIKLNDPEFQEAPQPVHWEFELAWLEKTTYSLLLCLHRTKGKEHSCKTFSTKSKNLISPAPLPGKLLAVHQTFDTPRVHDIHAEVGKQLRESGIMAKYEAGRHGGRGCGQPGHCQPGENCARHGGSPEGSGGHETVYHARHGQPRRRNRRRTVGYSGR